VSWTLGSTSLGLLAAGPSASWLYDATTNTWSLAGSPVVPRSVGAAASSPANLLLAQVVRHVPSSPQP
jgi:hypothetical protein